MLCGSDDASTDDLLCALVSGFVFDNAFDEQVKASDGDVLPFSQR
jgi:hypothetical protein